MLGSVAHIQFGDWGVEWGLGGAESAVVSRLGSGVACSVLAVGVASVLCVVGRYVDVVCASSQAV